MPPTLTGMGVYYGAGRAEGVDHAGGRVFVVGGGNSAGQAAVFMAQFAASVTLLVRGRRPGRAPCRAT